jgi:uncharacterized membrane protein
VLYRVDRSAITTRTLSWVHRNSLALGFVVVLTAMYSTLAVRHQLDVRTGAYDLGIFDQAIRNYAAFRAPIVDIKGPGFNLLGDHFHPILMLLGPLYALIPSVMTLLVAQAFLFALAAAPLVNWAKRSLGTPTAAVVGIVYGLSYGIASAVGFDFHEIAFAVPLLAFSLSALGQGRLRAASAWAIPLVLCKEDLGVTAVAGIGVLIAWRGARRLGIITAVVGVAATVLEITVLLPFFSTNGTYAYWDKVAGGPSLFQVAFSHLDEKLLTLLVTFALTGLIALFSPIVLIALPTLAWRFVTNDANYWGTQFHYSAVLMPIVVAAMIDGLVRWRRRDTRLLKWASRVALVASLGVTAALIPSHAFIQFFQPWLWKGNPYIGTINAELAMIPNGATVSASDDIVPQLTDRTTVTVFGLRPLDVIRPQWILVDSHSTRHYRVSPQQEQLDLLYAESDGYRAVMDHSGITLLHDTRATAAH